MCDCFKTRGETVIEERTVTDFYQLRVDDKITVYYTQDTTVITPTIKVVTGKHLVKNVITEVGEHELLIKNGNKCNFVRGSHNDITVYVTSPNTWIFHQDGVGSLYCTNTIKADTVHGFVMNSGDLHLKVDTKYTVGHMHGAGDLYLEGNTQNFFNNTIGQGFVYAQDLEAGYVFTYFGSTGREFLKPISQLDAVLTNAGNVYYYGNPPTVNVKTTGSGKLIHE